MQLEKCVLTIVQFGDLAENKVQAYFAPSLYSVDQHDLFLSDNFNEKH